MSKALRVCAHSIGVFAHGHSDVVLTQLQFMCHQLENVHNNTFFVQYLGTITRTPQIPLDWVPWVFLYSVTCQDWTVPQMWDCRLALALGFSKGYDGQGINLWIYVLFVYVFKALTWHPVKPCLKIIWRSDGLVESVKTTVLDLETLQWTACMYSN